MQTHTASTNYRGPTESENRPEDVPGSISFHPRPLESRSRSVAEHAAAFQIPPSRAPVETPMPSEQPAIPVPPRHAGSFSIDSPVKPPSNNYHVPYRSNSGPRKNHPYYPIPQEFRLSGRYSTRGYPGTVRELSALSYNEWEKSLADAHGNPFRYKRYAKDFRKFRLRGPTLETSFEGPEHVNNLDVFPIVFHDLVQGEGRQTSTPARVTNTSPRAIAVTVM